MTDTSPLAPQAIAELETLALKARVIVEGALAGLHRSPAKGASVEFAQHRDYTPGDDPRYLDWKAWARSDRYYLKQYEAETNFACTLLLDVSESMEYRSEAAAVTKREYATWMAAALARLVLRQRDAVGLATFDAGVRTFLRPEQKATSLGPILHHLEKQEAGSETELGPVLHELAERIVRRGVVIILSDFFDDEEPLLSGLAHFRHRRHDVRLVQVIDPAEQDFPFDQLTLFRGMENLPEELADPNYLADAYRAEFESARQSLSHAAVRAGMSYHLVRTDTPPAEALRQVILDDGR